MSTGLKLTGLLVAGVLCLPAVGRADTQNAPTTHRVHSKKKAVAPPPLPSGTRGPVPQVPLDAIPAVAPDVSYQDGLLTIVAPNSTLGDILRGVRKHTSADIDIPATATERVVTRLGPAPAREVMAELLNGSRFNYILLGSPADANTLVRVVLVAKTPDTPTPADAAAAANGAPPPAANGADAAAAAAEAEAADDSATDDTADQSAAEAEQTQPGDQPGVKTPQQLLQEMQQRQLQMQQQQQAAQPGVPTPPGAPAPHQPQAQPQPPPDQQ
ncbi:MAG: hypothetical protein ABR880_13365 [Candidatus Sulfotelmatobacter sp.]|jgi:hypothetical protein